MERGSLLHLSPSLVQFRRVDYEYAMQTTQAFEIVGQHCDVFGGIGILLELEPMPFSVGRHISRIREGEQDGAHLWTNAY